MKTVASNDFPEIEWEQRDLLESDPDERLLVYNGIGEDADGNKYSGSIQYICGEFDGVTDIETISKEEAKD